MSARTVRLPHKTAAQLVTDQQAWMAECGGTRAGYVARYGSAADPNHVGDGGEAIFRADLAELNRLERLALFGYVPANREEDTRMSYIVDESLLERFHAQPRDVDGQVPTKVLDALVQVVAATDHNVEYPNSPLGRADTIDALRNLRHALEETYGL